MEKVIKTIIALAIVAILVKEGLPWVQDQLGARAVPTWAPGAVPEAAADCLKELGRARGEFEATRGVLSTAREKRGRMERAVAKARVVCGCRLKACKVATQAIDVMQRVGDGSAGNDPTLTLTEVDRLISEAGKAARER